ncbi:phage tail protein [Aeromonas caviae]|uniref:phage tail-collar fiber domain-containing protein n=1 Tax=Aeromonas caviae TaxID=648 RepID=UPI0029D7C333|nr:phage tail protein [Aeromonas caviae]MDX7708812.1 phage tail protein [Aeromonas caviae]
MSQVITNAFEQYWQSSLAAEQPVVLDEFILADIPNLDITAPIDPDTVLPPESQIVHRQSVDQRGRINNNAVAYTIVMDTTVGDFSFNAMYLRNKQNGVIGMIVYKGREAKLKTDQTTGQTGNSLVKSMLMGYDQAAEATLTNVDAGTWQIDYAARLRGQDEDLRQLASQLYGHHTFIGDGFKVVQQDGGHQVTPGVAIIGGLRVELKAPEVIYPGSKPIGVWVDVHRAGSLLSEHQNHFTIITSVADLTDHVDSSGYQHFVAKLGTVQADGTIEDSRGSAGGGSGGVGSIPDTFALWKRSMAEAGYNLIGQFGTKLTIETPEQVVLSKDGKEVYAWTGALPKSVHKYDDQGSERSSWVSVSETILRMSLNSEAGGNLVRLKRSAIANAVDMSLSEFSSLQPLYPEEFMTLPDRIAQQAKPGSVDVHYAIQAALEQKIRPVRLGPYKYAVSLPVVVYPGMEFTGCGEDRTIIEKITTSTSGLPPKEYGEGQQIVMDVDAVVILDPPRTPQSGGSTFSLFNKIGGFQASKIEGEDIDYSGYAFYFPLVALSEFKRLRGWNTEFGVYSKNAWMISWNRVYSRSIRPWLIEGGTSNNFVDAWLIGAEKGDVSDCSGYEFRNLLYSTMTNCGADALGTDGRPYASLYNFAFCDITLINCACESSHLSTLMRAHQSMVNVDNFRTLKVHNKYKSGAYQAWIVGTGNSVLKFRNGVTGGLYKRSDNTVGANVPRLAVMDSGSHLEYVDVQDSSVLVSEDFVVINGTNSFIDYRSKGYTKHIGNVTPDAKTGQSSPMFDTSMSFKTSGVIETSNGINLIDTTNDASSRYLNFINFSGRYGYLRGDFGDASGGNATGLTLGVYKPGSGVSDSIVITSDKKLTPAEDNTQELGDRFKRWSVVRAGTGTIDTSDGREKTELLPIDDDVLDAWGDVDIGVYQWLDSIERKGVDVARWHFGVIAQQVRDVFSARGLNACKYGLLCYDEWDDIYKLEQEEVVDDSTGETMWRSTGNYIIDTPAGSRWGIRPHQCIFIEAMYQRRKCAALTDRVERLEKLFVTHGL